jgi:glycosyltransferase involved in cell wall biosynthesis
MTAVSVQLAEQPRLKAPANDGAIELTILMPCLNEAETLAVCIDKARGFLTRSGIVGEVLIADNGSTDGSQLIAEDHGARVVAIPERGYGAALIGGISAARGRFVIMGDADDSYDFESLDLMVERLRGGDELVMGNRFKGGIKKGAMPFLHKYLGNPVLSFLGRLLFRIPVGDFHCGLRGFSREAMLKLRLKSTGMEFASEMVVKSALHKVKMAEVPTVLSPDGRSRPPHLRTWRDGWRHLKFLLLHSPTWLFVYPGFAMIAMGLVGSALLSHGAVHITPRIELNIHTMVVCCFAVLIGAQLVAFGALAQRYAMVEGFLPAPKANLERLILGMTLEPLLRVAGVVMVAGLAGCIWAVTTWAHSDFGPILYDSVLRVLVPSLTAVAVAAQLAATAFLTSLLTIRR